MRFYGLAKRPQAGNGRRRTAPGGKPLPRPPAAAAFFQKPRSAHVRPSNPSVSTGVVSPESTTGAESTEYRGPPTNRPENPCTAAARRPRPRRSPAPRRRRAASHEAEPPPQQLWQVPQKSVANAGAATSEPTSAADVRRTFMVFSSRAGAPCGGPESFFVAVRPADTRVRSDCGARRPDGIRPILRQLCTNNKLKTDEH